MTRAPDTTKIQAALMRDCREDGGAARAPEGTG